MQLVCQQNVVKASQSLRLALSNGFGFCLTVKFACRHRFGSRRCKKGLLGHSLRRGSFCKRKLADGKGKAKQELSLPVWLKISEGTLHNRRNAGQMPKGQPRSRKDPGERTARSPANTGRSWKGNLLIHILLLSWQLHF